MLTPWREQMRERNSLLMRPRKQPPCSRASIRSQLRNSELRNYGDRNYGDSAFNRLPTRPPAFRSVDFGPRSASPIKCTVTVIPVARVSKDARHTLPRATSGPARKKPRTRRGLRRCWRDEAARGRLTGSEMIVDAGLDGVEGGAEADAAGSEGREIGLVAVVGVHVFRLARP